MQICRPVFLKQLGRISLRVVSNLRNIVGQRIQPHIDHVSLVEIYRNTPSKGGTGYAQIRKTRQQEIVHHLIFARHRLNKLRMRVDMLNQTIRIFAHLKEVRLLLCRRHLAATIGALAIRQLRLRKERLARRAIHTLVVTFINIALLIELLKNLLHLRFMIRIRRAHKAVIRRIHHVPNRFYLPGHIVHIRLRCHPCSLGL